MRSRLTRTGWLFLAIGVVFYFAALTSQSSLLLLLAGVSLGCLLANSVIAWRAVRSLEIQAPQSICLREGERVSQSWSITNRGKRASRFVQAESSAGVLFRIAEIAPGAQRHVVPDLVFEKRGVFVGRQFTLASRAPFGLIKAARRCKLSCEIIVGPAVYAARAPSAAGYDLTLGGKFRGHRLTTSGTYFAGVRPFQHGDPIKQVHWKSSAKGLGLMVKTFEEELSGRISFILDNGQPNRARIPDDCARAAGSLMFAALDAGHSVEVIDFNRLRLAQMMPFAQGWEILDALARLPFAPGAPPGDRPSAALERLSRRSAICFVLTQFNPSIAAAISQALSHQRQVSLYLPAGSPRPANLGRVPVFGYSEREIVDQS